MRRVLITASIASGLTLGWQPAMRPVVKVQAPDGSLTYYHGAAIPSPWGLAVIEHRARVVWIPRASYSTHLTAPELDPGHEEN